ncbi:MAG: fibronectin type III domain-containing protein [Bacteroidales bacterium]|nr:fibronectin type III domain-containing protein [Bacteroidales bacterium]
MALLKRLLLLLAAQSVFLGGLISCTSEPSPGEDSDKPGVTGLSYDDLKSGPKSISVFFFNEDAIEAGASSFYVQILRVENGGDNYDVRVNDKDPYTSVLLSATDYPNDECEFKNLVPGDQYQVRARANYPGGSFSPWSYMQVSDGEIGIVEVGYGLVNALDSAPANFSATAFDTKIEVSWSRKLGVDAYVLRWKAADEDDFTEVSIPKDATSYIIEDVKPDMEYTIAFMAEKDDEYSPEIKTKVKTLNKIDAVYIRLKTESAFGARFEGTTTSGVGVEFSVSNFVNLRQDEAEEYVVGIYRDEACTDLVQSWNFKENGSNCTNGSGTFYNLWGLNYDASASYNYTEFPGMFFSGLDPLTKYYIKVELPGHDGISATVEAVTKESREKLPSAENPVAVGDTLLFGGFDEFVWGGETFRKLPGVSSTKRGSLTSFSLPLGVNGYGPTDGYFICLPSQDIGFLTQAPAIDNSTYLKHWRVENSYCLNRTGYIRTGNGTSSSGIITPAFSGLKTVATIELSVDLLPDGNNLDNLACDYRIELLNNAVFNNGGKYNNDYILEKANKKVIKTGTLAKDFNWQRVEVTIPDVSPESCIMIGGADGVKKGLMIDNICIKVVSYADASVQGPVTDLTAGGVTSNSAIVTWTKPFGATSYKVRYKESSAAEWTELASVTEEKVELTGLKASTEYVLAVQAVGTSESEWVQTSFTTLDDANVSRLVFTFAAEPISLKIITMSSLSGAAILGENTSIIETPAQPLDLSSGAATVSFTLDVEAVAGGIVLTATLSDDSTVTRIVSPGVDVATPKGKTESINLGKWFPGGISTAAELLELSYLVNKGLPGSRFTGADGFISLLADIDMTGIAWIPVGNSEGKPFTGKFDGHNHVIDNINNVYNGTAMYMAGLFGVANNGAVIKNTVLGAGCVFDYTRNTGWVRQGAFLGFSQGTGTNTVTLENLVNKGQIIVHASADSQNMNIGGIVGQARGPVTSCRNEGKITVISTQGSGTYNIGGVIGAIDNGTPTVSGLENNADIDIQCKPKVTAGGIIGSAQSTKASGLVNRGTLKVTANARIGGLIGTVTTNAAKDPGALTGSAQYGNLYFTSGQGADIGLIIGTNNVGADYYTYDNIKLSGSWGVPDANVYKIDSQDSFAAHVQLSWNTTWKDEPAKLRLCNSSSANEAFYTNLINATTFGKE